MAAIETLGDLRDRGMGLYANCSAPNAGHGSRLDIDLLIERFGADYVYINDTRIERSLVCSKCGHRGAHITVIANTRPQISR